MGFKRRTARRRPLGRRMHRPPVVVLTFVAALGGIALGVYLALPDPGAPVTREESSVSDVATSPPARGRQAPPSRPDGHPGTSNPDRRQAGGVRDRRSRQWRPGAGDVRGRPRVVDADTIDVAGERVRLEGIDAPEREQLCRRADGRRYPCGRTATRALRTRIAGKPVACRISGRDSGGRALGTCYLDGVNLNRWLVASGHALAFRRYSRRYVSEEDAARSAGVGIHAGRYVRPWQWRRGQRLR